MPINIFLAGFGGGVARGLVGFIKHQFSYKNVEFNPVYFFTMMFISGAIGAAAAAAIKGVGFIYPDSFGPALSFIVGYAGGDFIENIYKIIINKSTMHGE